MRLAGRSAGPPGANLEHAKQIAIQHRSAFPDLAFDDLSEHVVHTILFVVVHLVHDARLFECDEHSER